MQILRRDWDPIGIGAVGAAQDEYAATAASLASLLARRASSADIADLLLQIERDQMGLPGDNTRATRVARQVALLQAQCPPEIA